MSWFKLKQKEVKKLGLIENYSVETESDDYVIMSSKLRKLTHQEALQEFNMLLSNGYSVLGWWNSPYTLLCRKVKTGGDNA